jgi:hypothetical protein
MKPLILPFQLDKGKNPNLYYNDGAGRDSYISFNNGGNFSPEMRFLHKSSEKALKLGNYSPSKPLQSPLPRLKYLPDGSGRDTYIM